MSMININEKRCTLCSLCISVCPRRILEERDGSVVLKDQTQCNLCGHCKAICPENVPLLPMLNVEEFEPVPLRDDLPGPDELMSLFRFRRSIRFFKKKAVERKELERIIEAGRFAPTGANRQPLQYAVLNSEESVRTIRTIAIDSLAKLSKKIEVAIAKAREGKVPLPEKYRAIQGYTSRWRDMAKLQSLGIDRLFFHAPAVMICHFNPLESSTPEADPGLAAMQMVLMAEALKLGTCFCGFLVFAIKESPHLRMALEIPGDHSVPFSFVVGYPDVAFCRLVSRNLAKVRWF